MILPYNPFFNHLDHNYYRVDKSRISIGQIKQSNLESALQHEITKMIMTIYLSCIMVKVK